MDKSIEKGTSAKHASLGNAHKLIKMFEAQLYVHFSVSVIKIIRVIIIIRYLTTVRETTCDGPVKYYEYGPRTMLEITKPQILAFVYKVRPQSASILVLKTNQFLIPLPFI